LAGLISVKANSVLRGALGKFGLVRFENDVAEKTSIRELTQLRRKKHFLAKRTEHAQWHDHVSDEPRNPGLKGNPAGCGTKI
jgi:hypothetical protein